MIRDNSPAQLDIVRARIIEVDERILTLIRERMDLATNAGTLKRAAGLPTLDPSREAAVVTRIAERARALDLPEEDVRQIFWSLIGLCRRAQASDS